MARVVGVDIPNEKRVEVALTYIYGIGASTSRKILGECGVDINTRVKDLDDNQLAKISTEITKRAVPIEGELRRIVSQNIRRLQEIKCYRGSRHKKGLPVRGQRTRTNARTRKGKKKTVGGMKKKLEKK